jgi:hypothetical protein
VGRGNLARIALASSWLFGCNAEAPKASTEPPKATPQVATAVRPAVAWPDPARASEAALENLSDVPEARAAIARSPVPVLAPTRVRIASPTLVVESAYYALSGKDGGATIAIQGTRPALRYENLPPVPGNRELRGLRGFVGVNEGIRTATWMEHGVAYSVDVECQDARDERCTSEIYLLELVEGLAFAGGSGR